jgi:hypothetical protein
MSSSELRKDSCCTSVVFIDATSRSRTGNGSALDAGSCSGSEVTDVSRVAARRLLVVRR